MRRSCLILGLTTALVLLAVVPADAQYAVRKPQDDRSIGEYYWFEVSGDFWSPAPAVIITSESLGIPGTAIDFVTDLGIEKTRFRQFALVLRPAKKHKFRVGVTPIKYATEHVLLRTVVFNGIAYQIGLPVAASLQWDAWRFGYEYDFIYRKRGYVGVILEAKYTDVRVNLDSIVAKEYARAAAPVPAIGGVGRVYVAPNVAVTFEVSGFGLPSKIAEDLKARYVEYDLYGTFNFNKYIGAHVGYRTIDVSYTIDLDEGDWKLKGPYFGMVVRF